MVDCIQGLLVDMLDLFVVKGLEVHFHHHMMELSHSLNLILVLVDFAHSFHLQMV